MINANHLRADAGAEAGSVTGRSRERRKRAVTSERRSTSPLWIGLALFVAVAFVRDGATRNGSSTVPWVGRTDSVLTSARAAQWIGTLIGLLLVVVAFRRLRRSDDERRTDEESLEALLRSIGDGVIATDADGCVRRMNPAAEALTGWSAEEARGRPFLEVFHIVDESSRTTADDLVDRVMREGVVVGLANHTTLVARDGSEHPIADSAAPIRSGDGELHGVVVVFHDVTDERAAAKRLREATAFLDSIVENIPHMIFVKEAKELRFERFNKAGESLLGKTRDQLLGKNDFDLFPEDQARFFQAKDREVLNAGGTVEIAEEPIDTPQGRRWLHTKKLPIRDEDGEPRWLLGISEDVTDKRIVAEQLRKANEDLEKRVAERTEALRKSEDQLRHAQKMEAVGRLAGGIAHDFNNLLSVILSYGAMIAADLPSHDPMRADLDEIKRAGERAADLTRQLLAFSRQQVLAPKVIDLGALLRGMDKMLRRVIGEDIELRTIGTESVGKALVDPGQIEQVVMNLVVNARDAMPKGGTLTLETADVEIDPSYVGEHPGMKPGPHVMLAVTDSGAGMDKATLARIFEPFFTTKEHGKGTGLGLSTVFGIVQQSGGAIWVYSEPGRGTTFKIYLPRVKAEGATERAPQPPPTVTRGSETILLVEDEAQVRTLARDILRRAGYQVLDAKDGDEALKLSERFSGPIHLCIADVVMPKMSGTQLVEKVCALRPETKALFMSGYTDDTVLHHGVLAVGVEFLQKPLTPESLEKKVREVLDAPERGGARRA